MKKLKIVADFQFAHHGYEVRQYNEGDVVDAEDPELIEISVREGWARPADESEPEPEAEAKAKAKSGAPENKARGK